MGDATRVGLALAGAALSLGACGGSSPPSAAHRAVTRTEPLRRAASVGSVVVGSDGQVRFSGRLHRARGARARRSSPAVRAQERATRPAIVQRPIVFGARRKAETAAYSRRHYGVDTWRLRHPRVIVEHYTETPTFRAAYDIFAKDVPDSELHELPGTCAHFVVDRDGTIYQLVPIGVMCRHTVGLNDTAIGIEQVGMSAAEILGRPAQRRSIVRLSAWLRCREGIRMSNVIGHAMSLGSPYHHEDVARLRRQTHADWNASELAPIKRQIARVAC